jgi:hypothetical protein
MLMPCKSSSDVVIVLTPEVTIGLIAVAAAQKTPDASAPQLLLARDGCRPGAVPTTTG